LIRLHISKNTYVYTYIYTYIYTGSLDVGLLDDEVYNDSSSPSPIVLKQKQPVVVGSPRREDKQGLQNKQNVIKAGIRSSHPQDRNPPPQDMTAHIYKDSCDKQIKNILIPKTAINSINPPGGILNRHFAGSAAVRDFNESMPVFVLPSNFKPERGQVRASRPSDRVQE
jgi:hypothetical protein